jgi:tryptophanyl-tRNA synthetase
VPPQAAIEESVATLPGLDGRKMSKSYDNTIPLFASREQLKKLIAGIVTDSRAPGEAKDTEGSALFQIYQAFATEAETATLRAAYANGIAWGDAKQILLERIDQEIAPMRSRYQHLMEHPEEVEALLLAGARKARAIATPFMAKLRHAVGLRSLTVGATQAKAKVAKTAAASFKQYREKDGKFYFKLADSKGVVLLQSLGLETPQMAGKSIGLLQQVGVEALSDLAEQLEPVADVAAVAAALDALKAAEA